MPCGRLAGLGVPVHPSPATHDAFDVLRGAGWSEHISGEHVHDESPPAEATLHLDFGASCEARQATIATRSAFLRRTEAARIVSLARLAERRSHAALQTHGDHPRKTCQAESASATLPPPRSRRLM